MHTALGGRGKNSVCVIFNHPILGKIIPFNFHVDWVHLLSLFSLLPKINLTTIFFTWKNMVSHQVHLISWPLGIAFMYYEFLNWPCLLDETYNSL